MTITESRGTAPLPDARSRYGPGLAFLDSDGEGSRAMGRGASGPGRKRGAEPSPAAPQVTERVKTLAGSTQYFEKTVLSL